MGEVWEEERVAEVGEGAWGGLREILLGMKFHRKKRLSSVFLVEKAMSIILTLYPFSYPPAHPCVRMYWPCNCFQFVVNINLCQQLLLKVRLLRDTVGVCVHTRCMGQT